MFYPKVLKISKSVRPNLDEVCCLGRLPGEGSVDVAGEAAPVGGDLAGVAGGHTVLRQPPVQLTPGHRH